MDSLVTNPQLRLPIHGIILYSSRVKRYDIVLGLAFVGVIRRYFIHAVSLTEWVVPTSLIWYFALERMNRHYKLFYDDGRKKFKVNIQRSKYSLDIY